MNSDNGIELITASIDYPEINKVKYDGVNNVIIFELAIIEEPKDVYVSFMNEIEKCLKIYYHLKGITTNTLHISIKHNQGLSFIRLHRDIETMFFDELKLFINVANKLLSSSLIKDDTERTVNKNNFKKNLLNQIYNEKNNKNSYLVYRENGRVIVHNR